MTLLCGLRQFFFATIQQHGHINHHLLYSCRILGSNLIRQRWLNRPSFSGSFSASKPNFCSEFVLQKAFYGRSRYRVPNYIDKSIAISAFADANRDEVVEVLEHEAYTGESFRSKFGIQELESSFNRVSKWIVTAVVYGILLWRNDLQA